MKSSLRLHRTFIQELMEVDAKIYHQALGRALGVPLKRGRKDYMSKNMIGKTHN